MVICCINAKILLHLWMLLQEEIEGKQKSMMDSMGMYLIFNIDWCVKLFSEVLLHIFA